MTSFRKTILGQIHQIDAGRIFTCGDLEYEPKKTANVMVVLSEQCHAGNLVRVRRGAYYRPKSSRLGLGRLPVYQDEQLRYLCVKLGGYLSGPYAYNKMGLTEQVPTTITIATPHPVRPFAIGNLHIVSQKAYYTGHADETLVPFLRLLDAIKEIKRIPGASEQEIYDRVKNMYFRNYSEQELSQIVSLATFYPPRVRKVVADLLGDIDQLALQTNMEKTLLPTTRYNLNYKTSRI